MREVMLSCIILEKKVINGVLSFPLNLIHIGEGLANDCILIQ